MWRFYCSCKELTNQVRNSSQRDTIITIYERKPHTNTYMYTNQGESESNTTMTNQSIEIQGERTNEPREQTSRTRNKDSLKAWDGVEKRRELMNGSPPAEHYQYQLRRGGCEVGEGFNPTPNQPQPSGSDQDPPTDIFSWSSWWSVIGQMKQKKNKKVEKRKIK